MECKVKARASRASRAKVRARVKARVRVKDKDKVRVKVRARADTALTVPGLETPTASTAVVDGAVTTVTRCAMASKVGLTAGHLPSHISLAGGSAEDNDSGE